MKNTLLTVIASFLLSAHFTTSAQAPSLGACASFVLYTSNGTCNNTGISHFTGNIGTNAGSISGFGNVDGVLHTSDGTTATASVDLQLAYGQLNAAIPTIFPAATLGNGDTINAGIYQCAGTTTLNGILTLNAKGDPNALFIIQLQGGLNVNAGSKMKLINGAASANVFWKVEGAVNVAPGAYLAGTIIAHGSPISLSANDTLDGRAMSTSGSVTLNAVTGSAPTTVTLNGPLCPSLGATSNFAVFSGNGAVTNTGSSHVTGDVGTNAGLTTGFNPAQVTGVIHNIPDVSTVACAATLSLVSSYLDALPTDIELTAPAQFGADLVLTPHTYLLNSTTSLTGNVYLNAQNQPNAVFVINVNGALNAAALSRVVLLNGCQAKNVFWKVSGPVTIGDHSLFNGTLVSNAAVTLNTGDTVNGRMLTTAGNMNTATVEATVPVGGGVGCAPLAPLPVSWLYFRGRPEYDNMLLEWGTTNEINNGFFTLERSRDGQNFELLTTRNALASGGSDVANSYSFVDRAPYMEGYYRISQTDNNGRRSYYTTIQLRLNKNNDVKTVQFVRDGQVYIQVLGAATGAGTISLYNVDGKKIYMQPVQFTDDPTTYKIDQPLSTGIYLLSVEANGQKLYRGKLLVQN